MQLKNLKNKSLDKNSSYMCWKKLFRGSFKAVFLNFRNQLFEICWMFIIKPFQKQPSRTVLEIDFRK